MVRGLLSDEEWRFSALFVIEQGPKRGRPPADHRRVLDAVFWIARTGSTWRDLPGELGRWASVYKQFLRWTRSGLWDVLMEALAENGAVPDSVQMIDFTIVRAHHCAAGAKKGIDARALTARVLDARAVASRPRSTSAQTRQTCPSASS